MSTLFSIGLRMPGEYQAYLSSILAAVGPIATRSLESDRAGAHEWMSSILTGEPRSVQSKEPDLRRDDVFVSMLFREFSEIFSTFDTLKSIPRLARYAPPRRAGVDGPDYLRIMVESYLSEVYILKQRCDTQRERIAKAYRKDKRGAEIRKQLDKVGALTAESFQPLTVPRGAHVHSARHDDPDLRRLRTLTLLATKQVSTPDKRFEMIQKDAFRQIRKKKIQWMDHNNAEIQKFLDLYFRVISTHVMTSAGKVRFPESQRSL